MTRVPFAFIPSPIMTQPELREAFVDALGRLGDVARAAAETGIPRTSLYKARKAFPEFAHAWAAVLRHRPGGGGRETIGSPRADALWSMATRARFLDALASSGEVPHAAAAARKSPDAAYRLRRSDAGFAADWDRAMDRAIDGVEAGLFNRALKGVVKPVFYGGKSIGETREFSEAAAMFLLRSRRRDIYGAGKQAAPAPPGLPPPTREELLARLRAVLRPEPQRAVNNGEGGGADGEADG